MVSEIENAFFLLVNLKHVMHMGNYYLENNNLHKEQVHKRPGSVRISIIQLIEMEI